MEMIIRKSITETVTDYLNTCSVGGIKQIRDPSNCKLLRLLWMCIFCVALSSVCIFLQTTWQTALTRPLIVTSESITHPIKDIDFPAVALCNFNRISHKALKEYSIKTLIRFRHSNTSLSKLENYFRNIGRLIDYRYEEALHLIIEQLPLQETKTDIVHIMQQLAPSCKEMLIKCKWAGKDVDCMDIFRVRRTGFGHCCAFNYMLTLNSADRYSTNSSSHSSAGIMAAIRRQEVPGANNGLMVVADPMIEDYEYRLGNTDGFQVLIFDPQQFPDLGGGRVLYRIAQPGRAEFLQIESIKQYATSEVRKYPRRTRKCLFHDELRQTFKNMYSYSACLVKCRIATVRSLCKCIPFFYPTGLFRDANICTLRQLRCLNKYKEKLLYLYPIDSSNTTGLESELADSMYCPDCLPDCELTQHYTKNYRVSLSKVSRTGFESNFLVGVNLTNKCFVNIYHPSPVGTLHRLDVVAYWFEILSNIGGFAGMIMGIGCFTFVEILYYISIRFVRTVCINYKKDHE